MQTIGQPPPVQSPQSSAVFPGRFTSAGGQDVIVFLIGMRLNGVRGLGNALRAFVAMPRMLAALERSPEKGCLGGHVAFGWRNAYVMQYWRSFEDLERFAKTPDDEHLPVWRWYIRLGRKAVGIGIWHETFRVAAGSYESIYVNMPRFGLAKATAHAPVGRAQHSARERIGGDRPAD